MPTDAHPGPVPAQLTSLSSAVRGTVDAVGRKDWGAAATANATLTKAWDAYRGEVPEGLRTQTARDVDTLAGAVKDRKTAEAREAALRVAQDDLDLQLRYQGVVKTDLARLAMWARQLQVDAAAGGAGAVTGDATTLGLVAERVRHTLEASARSDLESQLRKLQVAADNSDVAGAARAVPALLTTIQGLRPA